MPNASGNLVTDAFDFTGLNLTDVNFMLRGTASVNSTIKIQYKIGAGSWVDLTNTINWPIDSTWKLASVAGLTINGGTLSAISGQPSVTFQFVGVYTGGTTNARMDSCVWTVSTRSAPDIVGVDAGASSGDRTSLTSGTWFKASAIGDDDQVSFSWTAPANTSRIYYEYNNDAGGTIDGTEPTYTSAAFIDDIAINQTNRYFHVRPKDCSDGAGQWGTERVFQVNFDNTAPTTISNLDFSAVASTSVTLTWTACDDDSLSGWDDYEVYYRIDADPTTGVYDGLWKKSNDATLGTRTTATTTVTGLTANTHYHFKIRGKDAVGNYGTLSTNTCHVTTAAAASYSGVYWPGTWDWTNPSDANRLMTNYMPSGFSMKTRAVSGGDAFKITEGNWTDVWASGYGINAYDQTWDIPIDGGDASIAGTPSTYVTLVSKNNPDQNNTEKFGFLTTSAVPVFIASVSGGTDNVAVNTASTTITIKLSGNKCAEEKVWVVYAIDGAWASRSKVVADAAGGNTYTCQIPAQASGCAVAWYAITTTVSDFPGTKADIDYLTLSGDFNGGSNYSYVVYGPPTVSPQVAALGAIKANPALDVHYSDANMNIKLLEYKLDVGGSWTGLTTDGSTAIGDPNAQNYSTDQYMATASWSGASEGAHTIYFRATNDVDATSDGTANITFTKDVTAPAVSAVNTTAGQTFFFSPVLDVDFSDNNDLNRIYFQLDGTGGAWTECTTDGTNAIGDISGTTYTTNFRMTDAAWTALSNDAHTVYFKVTDDAGNDNSAGYSSLAFTKSPVYYRVFGEFNSNSEFNTPMTAGGTTSQTADFPNYNVKYLAAQQITDADHDLFKFALPSVASRDVWKDQWMIGNDGGNDNITVNAATTVINDNDGDPRDWMSIQTVDANWYYTFRLNPVALKAAVLKTSAVPRTIASVEDQIDVTTLEDVTIDITLSGVKCAEENIFLVYTTNNWDARDAVPATGDGPAYAAVIPNPGSTKTVKYYVITTTASEVAFEALTTDPERDIVTLAGDNNGDVYDFVLTYPTPINSWHIPQNNEPAGGSAYMRSATRGDAVDTMWPRRRTTDNPVVFQLGKWPVTDSPTSTLYYRTKVGGAWTAVNVSETVVDGGAPNNYFKFTLNQADAANWDYNDTISYYFKLTHPSWTTTYVYGNGEVDNIATSATTMIEATAQASPFIYRIISTAPDASGITAINPPDGANNVTTRRPTITWSNATDVDLAAGDSIDDYYFEISTASNMSALVGDQCGWLNDLIGAGQGDTSVTISSNMGFTDYYWRVKAVDNKGLMSDWSDVFSFTITSGFRRIDGVIVGDWNTGNLPTSTDTSLIKDSEYIWHAAITDERTDFFSPDEDVDIKSFRVTGDANNLYWMTEMVDISNTANPMVALCIDRDRSTGDGQNEIGGNSRTYTANEARWEIGALANLTRTGYWTSNWSEFKIRGDGWIESADTSNAMEQSLPWSEIGVTPPTTLRFTLIAGRADGVDFQKFGAWHETDSSRALDGITTGPRKASQSGNWWGEVSNSEAGYYFDVDFDTAGKVVMNNLKCTGAPSETGTFETFTVVVTARDFNGNPVDYTLGTPSITHNGTADKLVTVSSTGWTLGRCTYVFRHEKQETVTVTIQDPWSGKSDTFRTAFIAYPEMVISEIGISYGNTDVDSDFIEFRVKDDRTGGGGAATLNGWKLFSITTGGSPAERAAFGAISVRTDSFVVMWFNAYGKATEVTADGKRVYLYPNQENSMMSSTNQLFELRDRSGRVGDAVVYSDQSSLSAGLQTRLGELVTLGQWMPDSAAANTVNRTGMTGAGSSIRRADAMTDANTKDDWTLDSQTPGNMTLDRFVVTTDSANPTLGESFTLTVHALDTNNDTIVGARFRTTISVSAGTIVPTSMRFVPDHSDWNSGDTRCSVAIVGTSGAVTGTVAVGAKVGTFTCTVTAAVESFVVTASDPNLLVTSNTVKRGSAFNLRIVAKDAVNNTKTDYAGTVSLSIDSGTITPDEITFLPAWQGDTSCSVTISGGAAVGRMRITVTAGAKSSQSGLVVPLSDNRIVINEVLTVDTGGTNDRDEWVELYNRSRGDVSVTGWRLKDNNYNADLPAVTIPSGKFMVVHYSRAGTNDEDFNDTDGAAHIFPFVTTNNRLAATGDEVGLYTSTTTDSSTIVDFTAWTSGTGLGDTAAAEAGIWTKGDFISFVAGAAADRYGRTVYRETDGLGANLSKNDWSLMAANQQWLFTEGFPNVNTQPGEAGATLTLSTTSSAAGDTFAAGDVIYISLNATAGAGANPDAVDVTTVWVYSDTDPEGIVVWLKETGNSSLIFEGQATVASEAPLASHDGMRIIVAQPGDSLTVSWIKSPLVKKSLASVGVLDRFSVTSSASSVGEGLSVDLTIRALDKGGFTKTDWTGTVDLTASTGDVNPASAEILAGGNGETTVTVTFTASPGAIIVTATSATKTGTCAITILPDTDYVVNEVLATTEGGIDWDASSGVSVGDEWVELYNKGSVALSLAGYKLTHAATASSITLAGSIPERGWVTIYRIGANQATSYHYDSMGVINETRSALSGGFGVTSLPNSGGTAQLLDPDSAVIAQLAYSALAANTTYGRVPDGGSNAAILSTPSPGTYRTATPNNVTSPNTVFAVYAPDEVSLGSGFTLVVALQTRSGDTVTTFHDTATLVVSSGATISPTTLNFSSGVSTTTCTFTAGTHNESYSLTVYTYGAIRGVDTVTLLSVSAETSRLSVTQAIADGSDQARVQAVILTAAGSPLAGLTVNFSSSKGGDDVLSSATAVTDANGVAEVTVTSLDTTPSKISATVAGITLRDSPSIYWLDPAESGVQTSFGTKTTLLTVSGATHFIQFPQWRADGGALAYIAKTADEDTWNVYVATDDGNGNFTPVRVTGVQHRVNPASKIAFSGGDVIFSSFETWPVTNLYAAAADGSNAATDKASLTKITTGNGLWMMPVMAGGTMYAIYQGSIYRVNTASPPFDPAGGVAKILDAGTTFDFMIDGIPYAVADIVPYDENIMAVTMINNKSGDVNRNKRSVNLILTGVAAAGYRQWTTIDGSTCRRVSRPDEMIAWNLAWDANGRALTWARDVTGTFNWVMVRTRHYDPKLPYAGTNFDVEAIYVADDLSTPNRPVSLINNAAGFNDLSNSFSPAGAARTAYVSHDPATGDVKLNVLTIDGEATINEQGGLLFHNGQLTAVVDSGAVLSGSVKIQVSSPAGAPENPTPDSIALTGNAREFFPNGQQFSDSITVIIYYDDDDLTAAGIANGSADEYRLKVYWWNGAAWIDYNAVVDPADLPYARGKLTFQTNHFSTYGVGYEQIHPNRPMLLGPAQGDSVFSPRPSFSWIHTDPQSRAQRRYQVQISHDANHTQTILDETAESSETTVTLSGALPRGESTLFWRVRTGATDAGFGAWSDVDSFFATQLRAPLAPSSLQPADGVETRLLRPVFTWTHEDPDGDGQARFRIDLANDSAFLTIVAGYDRAETAGFFEADTLTEGAYYWRLATADQAGWGAWSAPRRLTIDRSPTAPTIVSAPETLTQPSPTFAWTHQHPEGAPQAAARLELSIESSFVSPFRTVTVNGATTSLTFAGEDQIDRQGDLTVYYRLQTTVDSVHWGKPATGVFAALLNPPLAPLPLEPAEGIETTAGSLLFRWTHRDSESDPQVRYEMRIGRDSAFGEVLWSTEAASSADSLVVALPGAGGRYWWQVATRDAVGHGPWSEARAFVLDSRTLTPLAASPASGALVQTPLATFTWIHRDRFNAPQSAAQFQIATETTYASPLRTITVTGAAQERTLTGADSLLVAPGDHPLFWRVRSASFGVDYGAWSEDSTFTLRIALPSTPTLVSPADGFSTRSREFDLTWSHQHASLSQDAVEVQLSRDSAFIAPVTHRLITENEAALWFDGGATWWRVRTAALTGWGPWSAARVVHIDTAHFAPALEAPIGGAILSTPTPTFRWRHLDPDGHPQTAVRIEIALETTFATPLRDITRSTSDTSLTLAASESIPLTGEETLYWRARTASYGAAFGPVSTESSFVARLNPPLAPLANAPADTTRNRRPIFSWTHRDSESNDQVAVRLQVARDAGFATPAIDETIISNVATGWAPSSNLAGGTWHWRAATRDAVGWGAWSAPRAFAIDTMPLWRRMAVATSLTLPIGETRTIRFELHDETGVAINWPLDLVASLDGVVLPSSSFSLSSKAASRSFRFDTAGQYLFRLVEAPIEDSRALTVLAVAVAIEGETVSSDTYIVVSGAAGDAQFVAPSDTLVNAMAKIEGANNALRLRIVAGDSVLVADTPPTRIEAGLAFWESVSAVFPPASRVTTTILRNGETLTQRTAYVLSNPAIAATFTEIDTTSPIRVEVPANASDSPIWVHIRRTVSETTVADANLDLRRGGRKFVEGSAVEITARAQGGANVNSFNRTITFRLPAAAANGLKIAYLRSGRWVELTTAYDSALGAAVAEADHLTVWGLVAGLAFGNSVNEVIVYPNPWRSDGPTARLGPSNTAYGVKFDRMPAGPVRIRVMTLAGELVLDGTLDPSSLNAVAAGGNLQVVDVGGATGQVTRWNLRNQSGREVASGTFIIILEGPGGRAVRKVAIIR
jgi:hypothetical protein